ncbi:MAG: DUF4846 domain-containing protein [Chitinophagales bacterium]
METKNKSEKAATLVEVLASEKVETTKKNISKPQKTPLEKQKYNFPWLAEYADKDMLINRIVVPKGYKRMKAKNNTFAEWLRHLPLKMKNSDVYLFDKQLKGNQNAHYAVLDIDVGKRDLQQCADAVMRLRAEYLHGTKQYEAIHFNFTSGDNIPYERWQNGERPIISGNKVIWKQQAKKSDTYSNFKAYLQKIFMYAGTFSLEKELKKVAINDLQIGDVFIKGAFPGHAVIVLDVAKNEATGDKIFLLAQSYMPAQDIHILVNPNDATMSPWYSLQSLTEPFDTPEWQFSQENLKRF